MIPVFARRLFLYACGWVPVVFFCTVAMHQATAVHWRWALVYSTTYLLPAVVVGFIWWTVAQRWPWRRLSLWKIVAAELGLAIVFLALWEGLFALYLWAVAGPAAVQSVFSQSLGWQLNYGLMV